MATRFNEFEFWTKSPLGSGFSIFLNSENIEKKIYFENSVGLPSIYNKAIFETNADHIVFLHDDVWINDKDFIRNIYSGLRRFDVIGVAGNVRRLKNQPAWSFRSFDESKFEWDYGFLSGEVAHGSPGNSPVSKYGPTPVRCEILDGVFIAVRRDILIKSKVKFDEIFDFHFYDMDFCRSARVKNLSLGTWPIKIIHQSSGAFGGGDWLRNYKKYIEKWGE